MKLADGMQRNVKKTGGARQRNVKKTGGARQRGSMMSGFSFESSNTRLGQLCVRHMRSSSSSNGDLAKHRSNSQSMAVRLKTNTWASKR